MNAIRTDNSNEGLSRQPVGEAVPQRRSGASAATGNTGTANAEVLGFAVVLVAVMALLAGGYAWRNDNTATTTTAQPATTMNRPATTGQATQGSPAAATETMTTPNKPRANPAEISTPPTQYEQGSGSATPPSPTGR